MGDTSKRERGVSSALTQDHGVGPPAPSDLIALLYEVQKRQAALEAHEEQRSQSTQQAAQRYRALFEEAPVGYLLVDGDGLVLESNLQAVRQLGGVGGAGQTLASLVGDESLPVLEEHLRLLFEQGGRLECELSLQIDEEERAARFCSALVGTESEPQVLVSVEDISERKAAERRLHQLTGQLRATNSRLADLAHIDALTRLGNRRAVERALTHEAARSHRTGASLLAVLIDCDDFKTINDEHGHAAGDLVLQTVAKRLRGVLRPSDHIGRVGGDEFIVLLPETSFAEGMRISDRLRMAVSHRPIPLLTAPVTLTCSAGAARIPVGVFSLEEVLSLTGLALKRSKRAGKNRVSTDEQQTPGLLRDATALAIERLSLGEGLDALGQPIYDLRSHSMVGVELLSRSDVPSFEMPADFFRAAANSSTLPLVDMHCLRTCAAASAQMRLAVRKHLNVFPSTLLSTPPQRVIELLSEHGDAEQFCIELSEQQMIGDPMALRRPVAELREAGISVAIDDVGFGRSSLETLILLEPSFVKIDTRFTRNIVDSTSLRRAMSRLINVLEALNVTGVATGIESDAELTVLKDLGVTSGQGYLLGVPSDVRHWSAARGQRIGAASSVPN